MKPSSYPDIDVIGLGIDSDVVLSTAAQAALQQADLIIGAPRMVVALPPPRGEVRDYPRPMKALWPLLQTQAGKRIALLTSGDPLCYGIGATLIQHVDADRVTFHPHVSSIQAAFARIKQPWQQARLVSLHGRPLNSLRALLQVRHCYALLTDKASHPGAIAALLVDVGLGESTLWIAENLGLPEERVRCFQANELLDQPVDYSPLTTVILETQGAGGLLPEFPGIPDERFITGAEPGKGMLSKREVRLAILSLLAPKAGEIGWDIGAGCGGVAVEWARWNPQGQVHAVECHGERVQHLRANRERFGVVNNLQVVEGLAPNVFGQLPDPHVIFIGGSNGELQVMLQAAWARLPAGGRLVASAVTEDSRVALYQFADARPAYWTEIRVARGERLAGQRLLRPYLPVLLMQLDKTAADSRG